jgi:hypothetical protein
MGHAGGAPGGPGRPGRATLVAVALVAMGCYVTYSHLVVSRHLTLTPASLAVSGARVDLPSVGEGGVFRDETRRRSSSEELAAMSAPIASTSNVGSASRHGERAIADGIALQETGSSAPDDLSGLILSEDDDQVCHLSHFQSLRV